MQIVRRDIGDEFVVEHRVLLDSRTEIGPMQSRVLRVRLPCLFRAERHEDVEGIDYSSFFIESPDLERTVSEIHLKVKNIGDRPRRFATCYVGKAIF